MPFLHDVGTLNKRGEKKGWGGGKRTKKGRYYGLANTSLGDETRKDIKQDIDPWYTSM